METRQGWLGAVFELLVDYWNWNQDPRDDEVVDQEMGQVQEAIEDIIDNPFLDAFAIFIWQQGISSKSSRIQYDRREQRLRMNIRDIFREIQSYLPWTIEQLVSKRPITPEMIESKERLVACLLDAFHKPLRWQDLTQPERVLAEAVAKEFLRCPYETLFLPFKRANVVHAPEEALEPRLRVFMNTVVRAKGKLPEWFEDSPHRNRPTPKGGFDA